MPTSTLDIKTDLHGSDKKLENMDDALEGMQKQAKKGGKSLEDMGEKFKKVGKAMTIAGAAIIGGLALMVKGASDAEETTAKFGTVFEDVFSSASKSAKELAESYGLSEHAAKEMLSSTGDLLTGLGLTGKTALDLSERTQKLSVDLASFTNFSGGAKGASEALTKAMLGERESVKALGIVVTEEMVKEELLRVGKGKLKGMALLQAKAEATLQIALKQSGNAIGDYARTSDSLANSSRELKARLDDTVKTIGTALIPVAKDLVKKATDIINKVLKWTKENPKLTKTLAKAALAVGALMTVLGPLLIILPKLAAGIKLVKAAMTKGRLATMGWMAVVALSVGAVVKLISTLKKLKKAKEADKKATITLQKATEKFDDKLDRIRKAAGLTGREFEALKRKYNDNTLALAHAILRGKEGVKLQEAMARAGKKTTDTVSRQKESLKELSSAYEISGVKMVGLLVKYGSYEKILDAINSGELEGIEIKKKVIEQNKKVGESTKTLTELRKTMSNEVKKLTLKEHDFLIEQAKDVFEKREELLKKEGGSSADFVLLAEAHRLELKQISADRVEDEKTKAEERKKTWTDYFKAIVDKEKEFKDFKKNIKDTIDKMTLDEFGLREKKSFEAYKAQLKDLENNWKDSIFYTDLKKGIEDGYSLTLADIRKDRAEDEKEKNEKSLKDAKKIMDDRLSYWRGIARSMTSVFVQFGKDLLDTNTSLIEDLKSAWDGLKRIFFQIIEDMIAKWITGFIDKLITSAAAGEAAIKTLTTATAATNTAIVGTGTAMAGTAAAATPFIATLGIVVAALAAVAFAATITFNVLKGLFVKVPKGFVPSFPSGRTGGPPPDEIGEGERGTFTFDDIPRTETETEFALEGFQHGGFVRKKQIVIVAEKEPEVIIPQSKLKQFFKEFGPAQEQSRQPLKINFIVNGRKIAEAMINDIRELSRLGILTIDQQGIVRVES